MFGRHPMFALPQAQAQGQEDLLIIEPTFSPVASSLGFSILWGAWTDCVLPPQT